MTCMYIVLDISNFKAIEIRKAVILFKKYVLVTTVQRLKGLDNSEL